MALPTSALYSARPSFELGGSESAELTDHVLSLVVAETADGLARCELVVGNWSGTSEHGYLFNQRDVVDFGSELTVRIGDGDRAGRVFQGRVTGIEAHYPAARPPEIVFLAEDHLQDLRMTRRTRTFEDASDADVIRDVVSAHGLTPQIDIDGPTHKHVAQLNLSDLAFVRDRARVADADVWIDGSTVHVVARARRRSETVTLTFARDLYEASVLADLAGQRSKVVVAGWDVAAKEAIAAEAAIDAVRSEIGQDTAGVDLLEQKLGARTETLVHTAPATTAAAQACADAELRARSRRFLVATGRSEGDSRLRVGARVRLAGLGRSFSGAYTLVEVEHTFDGRLGYHTRFRAERPGIGGAQ
jgi:phage protein D